MPRKCSLCGKCGHNKTSCPKNPKSKVGKQIAYQNKHKAFNKPKPLGTIHKVVFNKTLLGYQ